MATMYKTEKYFFDPTKYQEVLLKIFEQILGESEWDHEKLRSIQSKYPKDGNKMFSKNDLLKGYRYLIQQRKIKPNQKLKNRIRMKPIRTMSGVTPVTVLTKPWPCPGECIYCPNEPNMPKSYIATEPGAQRALTLAFDPYLQTAMRVRSLEEIGHNAEKIELIVLGGSWTAYPENYKRWFIKRCFDALNNPYAETVANNEEDTSWEDLEQVQVQNETAKHKCVGLSLETRPDLITPKEVQELKHYGATKVQIGVQSLNDKILKLNKRGHTAEDTAKAFQLLRAGGFKIHAHWMVNLYGATLDTELKDFKKLWETPYQPDELKIYPTAVIANTELETLYRAGKYKPYTTEELVELVAKMKLEVPPYCRITRIIRDIPAQEILAGNKVSNLRQDAKKYLSKRGLACQCIRCREIRNEPVKKEELILKDREFKTRDTIEHFISFETPNNKLVGFLRLSLPQHTEAIIPELEGEAIIREVHVYGTVVQIGKREIPKAQHLGLGKALIEKAEEIALEGGFSKLAVISAIGTREYYRKRGFSRKPKDLYMHKNLKSSD